MKKQKPLLGRRNKPVILATIMTTVATIYYKTVQLFSISDGTQLCILGAALVVLVFLYILADSGL